MQMKKKPIIKTTKLPPRMGVTRIEKKAVYDSQKYNRHIGRTQIIEKFTNETVNKHNPTMFLPSLMDELDQMKKVAETVLKRAGLPYSFPQPSGEQSIMESTTPLTDEHDAAKVLFHIYAVKKFIENNDAEKSVWNALRATSHYNQLLIDRYALSIGLEKLKSSKIDKWIVAAEKIRKRKKASIEDVLDRSRKISCNSLATEIVKNTPRSNKESIRRALRNYYESIHSK